MKVYPAHRYHPELGSMIVKSAEEDAALHGWFHTPADFGVETEPGLKPCPVIAAKRAALEVAKAPAPEPVAATAIDMTKKITKKVRA